MDEIYKHNPIRDHISHIPKAVTQHGLFLPSKDTPVITKKPCEESTQGRTYYTVESKTDRYHYVDHKSKMLSTYGENYSATTQPVHYKNPQKPLIPAALRRKPKGGPKKDSGISQTWNSMYRSTYNQKDDLNAACRGYKRLRGPPFSVAHPPQCLSEEKSMTCYSSDYGLLGSKPTDKLTIPSYTYNGRIEAGDNGWTRVVEVKEIADDTIMKKVGDVMHEAKPNVKVEVRPDLKSVSKLPTVKHDLTRGTTRATFHIPGYQGFIPSNTNNPRCAEIEAGLKERKPWTTLSEQYHLNLPGYSGHIPQSAINDKGTRQISMMTVMGRDYARNAGFVR